MESRSIGLRSTRLRWCSAPIRCKRIAARQNLQSDPGGDWKRGKSSEPRRCCARILKEISRSRNLPARAHFRKVISRGASGQVLARRSISASFNFGFEHAKDLLSRTSKSLVEVAL